MKQKKYAIDDSKELENQVPWKFEVKTSTE